jgi:hypothetical protein
MDIHDTGLPMGESDTVILGDGSLRAYVHASAPSLGVVDQCGQPVAFPGCVVLFTSQDGGAHFAPATAGGTAPTCLIPCRQCPCSSQVDHIDQQQYPRAASWLDGPQPAWAMVYEYRANSFVRRSADGLAWSPASEIPLTGIWRRWLMACRPEEDIGLHPYARDQFDCLIGSPPGLTVVASPQGPEIYVFVGTGQNPSGMGCYRGPLAGPATLWRKCDHHPLFTGSATYGPEGVTGPAANTYFDFRTISSADVVKVNRRYYMVYEGVRGPDAGAAGDTQFGLGLARSSGEQIDGPWETYAGNPVLVDLPGNVGVGHSDVIVIDGVTYLFTSLDGVARSRLRLVWL